MTVGNHIKRLAQLSLLTAEALSLVSCAPSANIGAKDAAHAASCLSNKKVSVCVKTARSGPTLVLTDLVKNQTVTLASAPAISTTGSFGNYSPISKIAVLGDPTAVKPADHDAGQSLAFQWDQATTGLHFEWRLILRDQENYLRGILSIKADRTAQSITRIALDGTSDIPAQAEGNVHGSPIGVLASDFFAVESPLALNSINGNRFSVSFPYNLPLERGHSTTVSFVFGTAASGQTRRAFAQYLDRERAHPSRTFLTYNSWYDIGFFNPYTEQQALERISTIGDQLKRRGVQIDSFLFDDGWDDRSGSWRFSKSFPSGLKKIRMQAEEFGAEPGLWVSPWGGYGKPKTQRVTGGQKSGFEVQNGGLALSGTHYYNQFNAVLIDLLQNGGVNQFKIDGMGNASEVAQGSIFNNDFDASTHLISNLRAIDPNLLVDLTTGTYASPYWLFYSDTIWRGGEDHDFAGEGSQRQRWITYRDWQTYQNVVKRGPLFPLSALMVHGIIYAQQAKDLNSDPKNDFSDEVTSYFGSGTDFQEIYITPKLLSKDNWNLLARTARWARDHHSVLKDSHWIGGDPSKLEIYGWAAWSPEQAIITLRNPSAETKVFALNTVEALELPVDTASGFSIKQVAGPRLQTPVNSIARSDTTPISLAPFQTITIELKPQK